MAPKAEPLPGGLLLRIDQEMHHLAPNAGQEDEVETSTGSGCPALIDTPALFRTDGDRFKSRRAVWVT